MQDLLSGLKKAQAIAEHLNATVKCYLAPSEIEGVGVFALRDISKGQKLGCQDITRKVFELHNWHYVQEDVADLIEKRWPGAKEGQEFLHPNCDAHLILYMNHSDEPNYDPKTDMALRDIKKGEEITENYGKYKLSLTE